MFDFGRKKKTNQESISTNYLVSDLERIYEVHKNYDNSKDAYLKGENEIEIMINKILELKSSQIREQFLQNSDIIESFTHMNYVKDMVDSISLQKKSMEEISISSEDMSNAIEEIANYVQTSLVTTKEAVSISTTSIETINNSFEYINKSFKEINIVQNKMHSIVEHTKESVNYIKDMIKALREEIGTSEQVMSEAANSMDKMKRVLNYIDSTFENIAANVEEQSVTTQEITARLSEVNGQTKILNDVCMRTGQGIYDVSALAEKFRYTALPYFKDTKKEHFMKSVTVEHLLLKWKAYNVACGFVKIDENSIPDHTKCNMGKHLEQLKQANPSDSDIARNYEIHRQLHSLTINVVKAVNNGGSNKVDDYLKELDKITVQFIEILK